MPEPEPPMPPEDEALVLSGELALGLLSGEEHAAALRRTLADPAFAALVEDWRMRFASLLDGIAAVDPPAGGWQRIETALAEPPAATPQAGRWRAVAVAALAAAACLALLLLFRPAPAPLPAPADTMVAQLSDKAGEPLLAARYDAASATLKLRTSNLSHDRLAAELWVIGSDAKPRSLGLVAASGATDLAIVPELRTYLAEGATLALTFEPRAGAPHAAPSGEILATAKLVRL